MSEADAPTPREALEPFRSAAESEASRPWVEDGYFTGPGGLTVGDWRRLRAALASPVERHVDLATIRSALADAIGKTDTLDDLAAFLVDRLQAAASTAAAGEGATGDADAAWRELVADALASDGPIRDSDVKDAVRRNRPRIEAAIRSRATSETPRETPLDVEVLVGVIEDAKYAQSAIDDEYAWKVVHDLVRYAEVCLAARGPE